MFLFLCLGTHNLLGIHNYKISFNQLTKKWNINYTEVDYSIIDNFNAGLIIIDYFRDNSWLLVDY